MNPQVHLFFSLRLFSVSTSSSASISGLLCCIDSFCSLAWHRLTLLCHAQLKYPLDFSPCRNCSGFWKNLVQPSDLRENFVFLPGAELPTKAFRTEICPNLAGSSKCRGLQSIVIFLGACKEAQTNAVLRFGWKAALWVLAQLWLGDLLAQCPRKMRLTQPCCLFLTAGSELGSSDSAGGCL